MKKKLFIVLAILMMVITSCLLVACGDTSTPPNENEEKGIAEFFALSNISTTIEQNNNITKYDLTSYSIQQDNVYTEACGKIGGNYYHVSNRDNKIFKIKISQEEHELKIAAIKLAKTLIFNESFWSKSDNIYSLAESKMSILALGFNTTVEKLKSLNLTLTLLSENSGQFTYTNNNQNHIVNVKDCGVTVVTIPEEFINAPENDVTPDVEEEAAYFVLNSLLTQGALSATLEGSNGDIRLKAKYDYANLLRYIDDILEFGIVSVEDKYYYINENSEGEIDVNALTPAEYLQQLSEEKSTLNFGKIPYMYWLKSGDRFVINEDMIEELAQLLNITVEKLRFWNLSITLTDMGAILKSTGEEYAITSVGTTVVEIPQSIIDTIRKFEEEKTSYAILKSYLDKLADSSSVTMEIKFVEYNEKPTRKISYDNINAILHIDNSLVNASIKIAEKYYYIDCGAHNINVQEQSLSEYQEFRKEIKNFLVIDKIPYKYWAISGGKFIINPELVYDLSQTINFLTMEDLENLTLKLTDDGAVMTHTFSGIEEREFKIMSINNNELMIPEEITKSVSTYQYEKDMYANLSEYFNEFNNSTSAKIESTEVNANVVSNSLVNYDANNLCFAVGSLMEKYFITRNNRNYAVTNTVDDLHGQYKVQELLNDVYDRQMNSYKSNIILDKIPYKYWVLNDRKFVINMDYLDEVALLLNNLTIADLEAMTLTLKRDANANLVATIFHTIESLLNRTITIDPVGNNPYEIPEKIIDAIVEYDQGLSQEAKDLKAFFDGLQDSFMVQSNVITGFCTPNSASYINSWTNESSVVVYRNNKFYSAVMDKYNSHVYSVTPEKYLQDRNMIVINNLKKMLFDRLYWEYINGAYRISSIHCNDVANEIGGGGVAQVLQLDIKLTLRGNTGVLSVVYNGTILNFTFMPILPNQQSNIDQQVDSIIGDYSKATEFNRDTAMTFQEFSKNLASSYTASVLNGSLLHFSDKFTMIVRDNQNMYGVVIIDGNSYKITMIDGVVTKLNITDTQYHNLSSGYRSMVNELLFVPEYWDYNHQSNDYTLRSDKIQELAVLINIDDHILEKFHSKLIFDGAFVDMYGYGSYYIKSVGDVQFSIPSSILTAPINGVDAELSTCIDNVNKSFKVVYGDRTLTYDGINVIENQGGVNKFALYYVDDTYYKVITAYRSTTKQVITKEEYDTILSDKLKSYLYNYFFEEFWLKQDDSSYKFKNTADEYSPSKLIIIGTNVQLFYNNNNNIKIYEYQNCGIESKVSTDYLTNATYIDANNDQLLAMFIAGVKISAEAVIATSFNQISETILFSNGNFCNITFDGESGERVTYVVKKGDTYYRTVCGYYDYQTEVISDANYNNIVAINNTKMAMKIMDIKYWRKASNGNFIIKQEYISEVTSLLARDGIVLSANFLELAVGDEMVSLDIVEPNNNSTLCYYYNINSTEIRGQDNFVYI